MARLIELDEALKYLTYEEWDADELDDPEERQLVIQYLRSVEKDLAERIKPVDAVPVVHAHWIELEGAIHPNGTCSNCGWHYDDLYADTETETNGFKICPNCGALMDEDTEYETN